MEIIISHAYRGHIKVASVNGMLKNNPCDLCCVQVLKTSSFSNLFISYLLTVILLIVSAWATPINYSMICIFIILLIRPW